MTNHTVSRRTLLITTGAVTLGTVLAACQPIPPLDHGNAAMDDVTAGQVTDRPTLRAFVEGAKIFQESITTVTGIARLRDIYRTEGRWKSGPVFLMNLSSELDSGWQ